MTRESAEKVLRNAEVTLGKLRGGRPMVLERKGRDRAVLLSVRRYRSMLERLEELEDAADIAAAREAEKEPGSIPWQEVKRDLGLK